MKSSNENKLLLLKLIRTDRNSFDRTFEKHNFQRPIFSSTLLSTSTTNVSDRLGAPAPSKKSNSD